MDSVKSAAAPSSSNGRPRSIEDYPKELRPLYGWRYSMQILHKKVTEEKGVVSWKDWEDATWSLGRVLDGLATFAWPEDKAEAERWIRETKIRKSIKRTLIDHLSFGDEIRDKAKLLISRWDAGDFAPAALEVQDDLALLSDFEDEEDNGITSPLSGPAAQLLQGIDRSRNSGGYMTMRLLPTANKRSPAVFGHNGLQVGDWWPYQICLLRDGAHGSVQGGIFGRASEGCFSIVVSAESEYSDKDTGDALTYSGTISKHPPDASGMPVITAGTKCLMVSMDRQKPVRVIRRGPGKRVYPSCGFRYDGLYLVTGRNLVPARGNRPPFFQFRLVRIQDQAPLESAKSRPTRDEYRAYRRLRGIN